MTFWPLTSYSDFPTEQIFHQFHDFNTKIDLHWITSGCYGAFAIMWHASRERLPFQTPGSVPFLALAYALIVETRLPELVVSLLDISLWIPLGTFSILHHGTISNVAISLLASILKNTGLSLHINQWVSCCQYKHILISSSCIFQCVNMSL